MALSTLPKRPEVLILDAGNTVVFLDTHVVAELATEQRVPLTGEAVARGLKTATQNYARAMRHGVSHEKGWPIFMQSMLEHAGASTPDAQRLVPVLWERHMDFNLWRHTPPDVRQALDALQESGLRMAIVSNSEGHVARLLQRLDLARFFEIIVDSGVEGVRKPDPEIFYRALQRLSVSAEQALYVGDIPEVDVQGAANAGMAAILNDRFELFPEHTGTRIHSIDALVRPWCLD